MIEVGNEVRIINDGAVYSTYPAFIFNDAALNEIKSKALACWSWGREAKDYMDLKYTVVYKGYHQDHHNLDILYVVNLEAKVGFIIGLYGVELWDKEQEKEDAILQSISAYTEDHDVTHMLRWMQEKYNKEWWEITKDETDSYAALQDIFDNNFETFEMFAGEHDFKQTTELTVDDVPESVRDEIRYSAIEECKDALSGLE